MFVDTVLMTYMYMCIHIYMHIHVCKYCTDDIYVCIHAHPCLYVLNIYTYIHTHTCLYIPQLYHIHAHIFAHDTYIRDYLAVKIKGTDNSPLVDNRCCC